LGLHVALCLFKQMIPPHSPWLSVAQLANFRCQQSDHIPIKTMKLHWAESLLTLLEYLYTFSRQTGKAT